MLKFGQKLRHIISHSHSQHSFDVGLAMIMRRDHLIKMVCYVCFHFETCNKRWYQLLRDFENCCYSEVPTSRLLKKKQSLSRSPWRLLVSNKYIIFMSLFEHSVKSTVYLSLYIYICLYMYISSGQIITTYWYCDAATSLADQAQ